MTVAHPDSDVTYWSRDYWLGHCEGFRVDSRDGRVGLVEDVVGAEDEPIGLLVRVGLFGRRVILVPIADVVEVLPRAERVILRAGVSDYIAEP